MRPLLSQAGQPGNETPNVTAMLARFAVGLAFSDLPLAVVAHTALSILDTLGVALAGSAEGLGCDGVLAYAMGVGSPGPCRIWWSDRTVAAGFAALANGARARALDYDDIIPFPQIHVATAVVPAVLALAETLDGVSGRRLLTAVAVGCEVQSCLAASIAPFFGSGLPTVQSSQVFGYFSAAAACGNLLGLDEARMTDALGLALMQAAGTQEMVVHAAESAGKSLYAGLSCQGGLQAALMAAHGVTARGAALEGQAGLFATLYGGNFDLEVLGRELGQHFLSLNRCFKAMPGTLVAHAFCEAAVALVAENDLAPDAIEAVQIDVGPWGRAMCEPDALRRAPPSASAAMNSIPFTVANAIAHRRVALADFTAAGRADPATLAVAARIAHVVDVDLARPGGLEPGIVTLRLANGRSLHRKIDVPLGHPSRPLTAADAAAKFRANALATALSAARSERTIDTVLSLDRALSVEPLLNLLGGLSRTP